MDIITYPKYLYDPTESREVSSLNFDQKRVRVRRGGRERANFIHKSCSCTLLLSRESTTKGFYNVKLSTQQLFATSKYL